jgi:hypothetical protein
MLTCPMCKKKLRGLERQCLNCRTDLSLLVDYVENLRVGLQHAEEFTRRGELGQAVWAYLAVLEVDPENALARRHVGQVATAVRQFDRTTPARRWHSKLQKQNRFRRLISRWTEDSDGVSWLNAALQFLLVLGALLIGYALGSGWRVNPGGPEGTPTTQAGKPEAGSPNGQSADKKETERQEKKASPAGK